MCGIVCVLREDEAIDQRALDQATDIMAHRGPDDRGTRVWTTGNMSVGMGHRRLSIIDLSRNGRQPMCNEDGTIWITYNGEIYNFSEVKGLLQSRGHRFRSRTDTEVIVHAYEEWGVSCLERLRGMFAFGIWDSGSETVFAARDRFGIKPLYYCEPSGGLAFASEIKALLQLGGVQGRVSLENIARYLMFLWAPDPCTPFEDIHKLPPGHYLVRQDGETTVAQYWDVKLEAASLDESLCRQRLANLLKASVDRHLVGDVPVGVFLSGGIDSSSILAAMDGRQGDPVTTYTVGYGAEGVRYDIMPDDVQYARAVADHLGNVAYNEIILDPEVARLWSKVIWHMDEPIGDTAALSTYLICRAASERTKVMLAGVGGDEIFAGYPRHRAMRLAEYYRLCPGWIRDHLEQVIRHFPASRPGHLTAFYRGAKKFTRSASLSFDDRYLGYFSYYTSDELRDLWIDATVAPAGNGLTDEVRAHLKKADGLGFTNRLLYLDEKAFLPCLNLTYTDKASMAASVEVRVPFLDDELVDFVAGIPEDLKLRGLRQKYILKRAMEGVLPRSVIRRRKAGFGGPVRAWVSKDLKDVILDVLSADSVRRRGLFDPAEVDRLLREQFAGSEDNAARIWELLTLELWFRTFVDAKGDRPIAV